MLIFHRNRSRYLFAARLSAVALMVLGLASDALGWGRIGHRVSSRLAEGLLTPRTRDAIAGLLDPGESIADASTWADEHRRELPETAPWHYVNVPIAEARYDAKFCQPGGCVVSKIGEFRDRLADPAATRDQKRLALRFLIHCVQDMHQPVHVGDRGDRGGNDLQVRFFDAGSNLHRVWDSGLIERVDADEFKTFARLEPLLTPAFREANRSGAVEDWATESLIAAQSAYNDPVDGTTLKPGAKLADAYQAANYPVAERRLMQASIRLARLLNEAFDPTPR